MTAEGDLNIFIQIAQMLFNPVTGRANIRYRKKLLFLTGYVTRGEGSISSYVNVLDNTINEFMKVGMKLPSRISQQPILVIAKALLNARIFEKNTLLRIFSLARRLIRSSGGVGSAGNFTFPCKRQKPFGSSRHNFALQ